MTSKETYCCRRPVTLHFSSLPGTKAIRLFLVTLSLLLLIGLPAAISQHNLVLYNMPQVPQSSLLNPGQIPLMNGYFGFPLISGVKAGVGNTGFTYNQFDMSTMDDAYDFNYNGLRMYLKEGTNRFVSDNELRLLSFGSRVGKGFFHVDVGDVVYLSGSYTPDGLDMFHDIQQQRFFFDDAEATFDLSGNELNGAYYRSYSVGYAHQVLPNLSVGGRFRYLQGKLSAWTENEALMFRYPGDGNYFRVEGQMNLLASGLNRVNDLDASLFLFEGGNHGFAIDFGGVYRVSDKVELSFSAVNLGQISWKKDINYQVIGDHLQFSAIDIGDHLDLWGEVADSLVNGQPFNEDVRFTTPLPQRYYLGGNYYFRPNTSVGLVINPVRFNGATDVSVALSGNTRVGRVLGLSAAVAYNRYTPFNLGLGLSLDLGFFQLYALTDNLIGAFDWKNSHTVQGQVGINFNFGAFRRSDMLASLPITGIAADTLSFPQESPPEEVVDAPAPGFLPPPTYAIDPQEPPVAATPPPSEVNPRFFTLAGTARDADSGEILKGIAVEAYKINQQGEKELAYTGSFFSGHLSIPLNRSFSHEIIVSRLGYEPSESFLEASRVDPDRAEVKRDFELRLADNVPVNPPLRPAPPPLVTEEEEAPAPPPVTTPSAPEMEVAVPLPSDFGTYRLLEATSLRSGPSHTTGVILRFQEGDEVKVLERTDEWWWKVRYGEQTGYVKAHLLEPR